MSKEIANLNRQAVLSYLRSIGWEVARMSNPSFDTLVAPANDDGKSVRIPLPLAKSADYLARLQDLLSVVSQLSDRTEEDIAREIASCEAFSDLVGTYVEDSPADWSPMGMSTTPTLSALKLQEPLAREVKAWNKQRLPEFVRAVLSGNKEAAQRIEDELMSLALRLLDRATLLSDLCREIGQRELSGGVANALESHLLDIRDAIESMPSLRPERCPVRDRLALATSILERVGAKR